MINLSGLSLQSSINDELVRGNGSELFAVTTTDPMNAASVTVEGNSAKLHLMGAPLPRFDGSDVFSPQFAMGARLSGALSAGRLSTTLPPLLTAAQEQSMQVRLPLGSAALVVPLRGVHVEGTLSHSGALWRIQNGVLHGVISKADLDSIVIPGIADMITQLIHDDTVAGVPSDTAKAMIGIFETTSDPASVAKCMVSARCCRTSPATCVILPAEITDSPIGGVLAPDVQVFDAENHWAPVPGGKNYNGMSFGIGFSAVTASY